MDAKLKEKIGALARRNMSRVAHQRHELHDAVHGLKLGEFYRLSDIFDLTHQIAGSSGTFGFTEVSRTAGAINAFVLTLEPDEMHLHYDDLDVLMLAFDDAVALARSSTMGEYRRRRGDSTSQVNT